MTSFSDLKLAPAVATALEKIGYDTPTPIQARAIPSILEGRDIQGIAQTGTGKTAAFTLPVLSRLSDDPKPSPKRSMRVLILSPTRELARQISESVTSYARHIDGFSSTVIFGGVPLSRQVKKVVGGNDVIVATPGRLIDLMDQKIINLKAVEYLVLDEADQMMDMGFIHALKKIIPHLPETRQTLFFSATMPKTVEKLAAQFLTNPVKVAVSPESTTAERVEQSVVFVKRQDKHSLLCMKLLDPAIDRALVFTRTKHGADRVVKRLAAVGLKSVAIHGNKSQGQRTRALAAFKSGEVRFLIATDIAARGIDIRGVSHVFNFEIPNVPEQYVHRIGRTGRAGEAGIAIAFVGDDEKSYLRDIQKMLKTTLPVDPMPKDFADQLKALKTRKPLGKDEMALKSDPPASQGKKRKGRKSRPAFGEGRKRDKHRKGPSARQGETSGDIRTEILENDRQPAARNTPKRAKKPSDKPSRADRKRSGAAARGEGKPFKKTSFEGRNKPRRASGERSEDMSASAAKPNQFKRKPRRDDDRASESKRSDTRGYKGRKDNNRKDGGGDDRPRSEGNRGYKGRKDNNRKDGGRDDRPRSEGSRGYKGRKDNNRKDGGRDDRPRRDDSRSDRPRSERARSERPRGDKPSHKRDDDRGDKNSDNKRGNTSGQQGGYGSPKRRSSRNDNPRSGDTPRGQSPSKGRAGDKSKFKRKPRANSRPNKPRNNA